MMAACAARRLVRQAACAGSQAERQAPQPIDFRRNDGKSTRAVSRERGSGTCFRLADLGADFFPDILAGKV